MTDKESYQRILKALSEREVVVIVPTTDPRLKAMEVAHQKAIDHRSDNKLPQPDQTKRRRKEKGEHEDVDLATMVAREVRADSMCVCVCVILMSERGVYAPLSSAH